MSVRACLACVFVVVFYSSCSFAFTQPAHDSEVGAIASQHGVGVDGSANYSLPIAALPGNAGIQPELAVSYNSNGGNGILGVGWSLGGLSVIHRCPATLEQDGYIDGVDFEANDKFCLDGQRLVLVSGTYGANGAQYRTENETFTAVYSYGSAGNGPSYFKVRTRDGNDSWYGSTADSRIEAQGKNDVYVWAISKVENKYTNYMTFTYEEDNVNGDYRPLRIDYTGNTNAGVSPYNSVRFEYETRTDSWATYTAGSKFTELKRLKNIKIFSDQVNIQTYKLTYSYGLTTKSSLLKQIEHCAGSVCLPATTFNWEEGENSLTDEGAWLTGKYSNWTGESSRIRNVDMDGDGLQDVLIGPDNTGKWFVLKNTGTALVDEGAWYTASNYSSWDDYPDRVRNVDMNGDGLQDILLGPSASGAWYVLRNTGSSLVDEGAWLTNKYGSWDGAADRIRNVDMNGDGLQDVLIGPSASGAWYVLRNTGSSLVDEGAWLTNKYGSWDASSNRVRNVDMNGDGLLDVLLGPSSTGYWYVLRNTGSSLVDEGAWLSNKYGSWNGDSDRIRNVDMNGDGLQDVLIGPSASGDWYVLRNTGSSLVDEGAWLTNKYGSWNGSSSRVHNVDMNGDGLQDVLMGPSSSGGQWYVLRNTGSALVDEGAWISNKYASWDGSSNRIRNVDMNGDGLPDVLLGPNNSGNWYVMSHSNKHPDHLVSVENGLEVTTEFVYKPLTDNTVYTKGSGATYPVADQQHTQYVVSEMTTSNGIGGVFTTTYTYQGLRENLQSRHSLGFEEMTIRNEDTGIETTTYFSQDYANHTQGSANRVKTVADNGSVLSDTVNTWNTITVTGPGADRYRRQLTNTEVTKKDLNGAFLHRETNAYTYDSYDNPLTITSRVYNSSSVQQRVKTTTNTYTNDTTNWVLGLMTKSVAGTTKTGQPTITLKTGWEYYAVTGRKKAEKVLHPTTETVLSRTDYQNIDNFGNATRTEVSGADFETRATEVVFNTQGRYILTTTNAIGQSTNNTYYPDGHVNAGLLDTATDINGLMTKYEYDVFGRGTEVTAAYSTTYPISSYTSFQWCANMGSLCPDDAVYGITTSKDGGGAARVYIDMLGRELMRSSQSFDGGFAHVSNEYDALGRNYKVSEPYFDTDIVQFTTVEFDVLGRVTTSTFPDGRVDTVTYNGLTRTSKIDIYGKNQQKIEYRDPLDNLTKVRDNNSKDVTFSYDSLGNLRTVTDPSSNVTTINYDELGRKTSMDDPDKGVWSYTYNGLGLLVSQTDAKSNTTCNAYDKLGRMVKRIDNYQGTVVTGLGQNGQSKSQCSGDTSNVETATWVYDTASGKGKGQLHKALGKDGYQQIYTYDSYGRNSQLQQVSGGSSYYVNTSYDAYHRVNITTYPGPSNRLQIKNIYNSNGFLSKLRNAANNDDYYSIENMDARGNITYEKYENGLVTERVYDSQNGHLKNIYGKGEFDTSYTVQELDFDFDEIGNLTHREDHRQNFSEDFTYDNLNRLQHNDADFGNGDIRRTSVYYDNLGNITSKTGVGSYTYGGTCSGQQAGPHAVTAITSPKSASYCYDANGNMISGDGRTIQYAFFDKPEAITKGSTTTTIKYGPDRTRYQRIDQASGGTTTYNYVAGIYEKVQLPNSQTEERHFVGDFTVVTYKNRTSGSAGTQQTRYMHKDHLGSTTLITDEIGNIVEEFSFDPWGKRRAPNLATLVAYLGAWSTLGQYQKANLTIDAANLSSLVTNKGFTGHEQLDPVGLIHMNGRVYDAEIGRFISADPHIQDSTNLQALNRYSYVLNNPLSFTDPSGFFFKKLFKKLHKLFKEFVSGYYKVLRSIRRSVLRSIAKVEGLSTVISIVLNFIPGCQGWCSMAFNAAMTQANGASFGGILKGAAVGLVSNGLPGGEGLGGLSGTVANGLGAFGKQTAGQFASVAVASGISAKAMGGKFIDGVKGAAVGLAIAYGMQRLTVGDVKAESTDSSGEANPGGAREAIDAAYKDGRLDSSKIYDSAEAAATAALDVVHPISEANNVELGGLVYKNGDGFSYGKILIGDSSSVSLGAVGNAVAGFHTHPGGAAYSVFSNQYNSSGGGPGDAGWVARNSIPLYMSNQAGAQINISICSPNSARCRTDFDPDVSGVNRGISGTRVR